MHYVEKNELGLCEFLSWDSERGGPVFGYVDENHITLAIHDLNSLPELIPAGHFPSFGFIRKTG